MQLNFDKVPEAALESMTGKGMDELEDGKCAQGF
jgi:hypothetical protein